MAKVTINLIKTETIVVKKSLSTVATKLKRFLFFPRTSDFLKIAVHEY